MATIGIDFGTSHSCVTVLRNEQPEVIPNDYGNSTTASWISFDSASKSVVGDSAKDTASTNPKATISSLKAILGRRFRDPFVKNFKNSVQYNIVDQAGLPHVRLDYKSKEGKDCTLVSMENAASRLFSEFKRAAELHLRTPVRGAVITSPVYFGASQRDALRRAAENAGLQVPRIIHESSAILAMYALHRDQDAEPANVAVVDFGAGSIQVTIAAIAEGVIETRSVYGSPDVGGDSIDLRLLDYVISKVHRAWNIDLRRDPPAHRRLRTACERAKRQLSSMSETDIHIENLAGGQNLDMTITRAQLEYLCDDLFFTITNTLEVALGNARLPQSAISEVLLVGGSAKMPKVQHLVRDYFQRDPIDLDEMDLDPSCLVALGAALLSVPPEESPLAAAGLAEVEVLERTIGVETLGGAFFPIARRNSPLPLKETRTFVSTHEEQTRFIVRVFEGDQGHITANTLLTSFEVTGIDSPMEDGSPPPRAANGAPHEIDVTVEVDENHQVKVYATHNPSNRNIGFELCDDVLLYDWSTQSYEAHGSFCAVDSRKM
ncbi:HSP70-domain-containing protein [Clavulina sp. PMI_390]|nr:HSP70-domain-containing protein [Clavulina sp. PMI_390]